MRAVNLVPNDQRSGGLSGGRSGGMAYGVLGLLALLLVASAMLAMAQGDKKSAEQELASVQTATAQYTSAAASFAAYEAAAAQATARIESVKGLAEARFDWAGAMRDLSRVVPRHSQILAMSANVRPAVGSPSTSSALRDALVTPAITFTGCSTSQESVADLVKRLEAMRRVTQVTLERSARMEGGDQCTVDAKSPYELTIVVFFASGTSAPSAEAVPGEAAAAGGATPAADTTTPTEN